MRPLQPTCILRLVLGLMPTVRRTLPASADHACCAGYRVVMLMVLLYPLV
jgi:hypothetical protein